MITLKKVQLAREIEQVSNLAEVIWQEHYIPIIGIEQVEYMLDQFQSPTTITQQIKTGYQYYLLIYNDSAVGYISYIIHPDHIFLSKIYVLEAFRGMGIGKGAVQHIIATAKEQEINTIRLTANKNNSQSLAAYQKIGFITIGTQIQDIGSGFVMDDYVLELYLSELPNRKNDRTLN